MADRREMSQFEAGLMRKRKMSAMKRPVSKPVPLGGVPQGSVPAKNTGGAEKKSWGGWSPPKKVAPSRKTAGGVAKRATKGKRVPRG